MIRRIESVFNFDNYRLLLKSDFFARTSINESYSLRSYARDLGVSFSYLSEVLNDKKDFSSKKGREVFTKLGLNEDELDYIGGLIVLNSSDDEQKIAEAKEIFYHYHVRTGFHSDANGDQMLSSVEHFLVFSFLREFNDLEEIYQITDQLLIKRSLVSKILQDFSDEGVIKYAEGRPVVVDPKYMVTKHQNYCQFLKKFSDFFFAIYQKENINRLPDKVASGLILGLDESVLEEVQYLNKFYINGLLKIANKVEEPTTFAFLSHLYLEKKMV